MFFRILTFTVPASTARLTAAVNTVHLYALLAPLTHQTTILGATEVISHAQGGDGQDIQ